MRFAQRVRRLENQLHLNEARKTLRIVVTSFGGAERAKCVRTRCPNGTLIELVDFGSTADPPDGEVLENWIASFPIEPAGGPSAFRDQQFGNN